MKLLQRLSFPIFIYFIALSLVGLCLIPWLPVKVVPGITIPQMTVSYSFQGQSPRAVESSVTSQLERVLSCISGIKNINSISENGCGKIILYLDKNANQDAIRFEVSTAIRQLWPQLPEGTSYPRIHAGYSDTRAISPMMTFTLNGNGSAYDVMQFAETHIRPQLSRLDGISSIYLSGATPMEWRLEYDKDRLQRDGVTSSEISNAIANNLEHTFAGMTSEADSMFCSVYVHSTIESGTMLKNIPVKKVYGKIVRVGELVTITHQEQKPTSHHRINGLNTIYMQVYANEQANQIRLSNTIRKKVKQLQQTFPQDYAMQITSDESIKIKEEITNVTTRSATALILLLIFIFVLHRDLHYMSIILLSVGATITISFIFYYLLDIEIQVYSIAGITISLGLIIDNILIMADHMLHHNKMNIFMAILASTLTTIASLAVVFFLDEKTQLNLWDFSRVLIINLSVSLMVALLLVPALFSNTHLKVVQQQVKMKHKRALVSLNQKYIRIIRVLCRHKRLSYVALILLFGIPTFLLPSYIKEKGAWADNYNMVMGSDAATTIRSIADPLLGGTLRLFYNRKTSGHNNMDRQHPHLYIQAFMSNGSTLEDMDSTIRKVESTIMRYNDIERFETHIHSPQSAYIDVSFTKRGIINNIPNKMRDALAAQVVHIGNATWTIRGVGNNFDNNIHNDGRSCGVKLKGFNYDELMHHAQMLSKQLELHPRIKRLIIVPPSYYSSKDYEEYIFKISPQELAMRGLTIRDMSISVQEMLPQRLTAGELVDNKYGREPISLWPTTGHSTEIWDMKHRLQQSNGKTFRLGEASTISRQQIPQSIEKERQEYVLFIRYDFVGNSSLGNAVLQDVVEEYRGYLPMGYSIEYLDYYWDSQPKGHKEFWVIVLVVLMIYIICCILYNSFVLPLVVIVIIPISYIGIFLGYTALGIPMNQGGFAAFILLSGLTCNSVIYMLNDYMTFSHENRFSPMQNYIKAFNSKIIPVFLTIVSTALGFIPFMFDAQLDSFWMSLSIGTICGLFFSMIGIFIYLPLMLNPSIYASPKQ